jgi:hypothetical protein
VEIIEVEREGLAQDRCRRERLRERCRTCRSLSVATVLTDLLR